MKRASLWPYHALMLLASLIVSSSFTIGKAITGGLDPAVLTLVRYVVAVCCFAPLIARRHGLVPPPPRRLLAYASISFVTSGFFWCMFASLRATTAINTSVIFTLVPGISGIYSALFLGERLGRARFVALFMGMLGAVWVIFRGSLDRLLCFDVNTGDALFLAGCFLMAAYTPLVRRVHRGEPMLFMTFWVLVTGIGWLTLLSLPALSAVAWIAVPGRVWAGIVYLATFSTIVTFYLTHIATVRLGPTRVMAYSYFYPAFVLLLDWLFGHGFPPPAVLPGVLVVTLAMVVVQRGAVPMAWRDGASAGERR